MKLKASLIVLCFFVAGPGWAIRHVGGGGGGMVIEGHYMTYYSAKIAIEPEPMAGASIPGMSFLIQHISEMNLDDLEITNTACGFTQGNQGATFVKQ